MTPEPVALLAHLRALGLSVREEAGVLWVTPKERLTPTLSACIRTHKPALLALLAYEQAGERLTAAMTDYRLARESFQAGAERPVGAG